MDPKVRTSGMHLSAGCYAVLEVDASNLEKAEAINSSIVGLVQKVGARYHGVRTFKSGSMATHP